MLYELDFALAGPSEKTRIYPSRIKNKYIQGKSNHWGPDSLAGHFSNSPLWS